MIFQIDSFVLIEIERWVRASAGQLLDQQVNVLCFKFSIAIKVAC